MESQVQNKNIGIEILVVEDSPTQALHLKHILMQHGYSVVVSKDGTETELKLMQKMQSLLIK